jgi:hypothetical protein
MPVHRVFGRLPAPARVRYPLFDVPVLLFTGAWLLVMSWDAGGPEALIFPGAIGWILIVVASLRVVFRWRSVWAGQATVADPAFRRMLFWVWAICALAFVVLAGGELFVGRLMPQVWRQALAQTFHIRRVYREYGP